MNDKKKSLKPTAIQIASHASFDLDLPLDAVPEEMSHAQLVQAYKTLLEAWKKEFSEAEQCRREQKKINLAKQNPRGFLNEVGLKSLNKKILIRLAMLRYNGIPDYPYVDCGEYKTQTPFTRKDMAERLDWKIDPPSGHYVEALREHIIDAIEEELRIVNNDPRKLSRNDGSWEAQSLSNFLSVENIYELIGDLN